MLVRRVFRSGGTIVVPIPRAYREALHILPGTPLTMKLVNRELILSRAIITPESMLGAAAPKGDPAGE